MIEMKELEGFKRAIEALALQMEVHEASLDFSASDYDWHAIQDLLRVAHRLDDDLSYEIDDWAYDLFKSALYRGLKNAANQQGRG